MKKGAVQKLVKIVEAYCAEKGLRFTEPRRYVLEIIAGSSTPIGAYDVLAKLSQFLDHPKPPTAYRAIEFLQENGFIHRIESLNAFITCHAGHKHSGSQFMICDQCGTVIEAHLCELPKDLARKTEEEGFVLSTWNAELHGQCKSCQRH
ncbi:MAG: transcriptional repressor [Alphaproteobacteria bacterium]|nr:transcriptional repressor [Alphaproteobacteria bacterium]MBP7757700.1 transcriptional repressor [Alphaproteobacteria bacterium]MBP7761100.1 transcriptional repressor [Alphaproteobacteria bacterium]MBP7904710.1 transcriptional repressor [Alphaproteobacteria bacterium]